MEERDGFNPIELTTIWIDSTMKMAMTQMLIETKQKGMILDLWNFQFSHAAAPTK